MGDSCAPLVEQPYLVVAGPTAVGKSAVAIELAERLEGEIVIADSRQVYKGIEIGTAKPSAAERRRTRHHLLGIVELGTLYTAADFARDARAAVADIQARGRTAVVCGGTGFYLAALAGALDPLAEEPSAAARAAARARVGAIPRADRHAALARVDPRSARRLHPHDRRRVERALEVYFLTGRSLAALQSGGGQILPHLEFRLTRPRAELRARIEERLAAMLEAGLEAEARALWEVGWTPCDPGIDTIGIQEWWPHFGGERDREATVEAILTATTRYAKRQETWFRHQGDYDPVPAEGATAAILAAWMEKVR
ncbi:MAG TPA: tRNA (adenosine(37)-N6)-dimethylallyltransferase MiaA [Gemmatimonadota bacterium]|nr:tRNA (adenosine(37)-N6)-dimethylallyltransferase MiaA [Gemmatimonadota bacterium]